MPLRWANLEKVEMCWQACAIAVQSQARARVPCQVRLSSKLFLHWSRRLAGDSAGDAVKGEKPKPDKMNIGKASIGLSIENLSRVLLG